MASRKHLVKALVRAGWKAEQFDGTDTDTLVKFCETKAKPDIKRGELSRVRKFAEDNREAFERSGTTVARVCSGFMLDKNAVTAEDYLGHEL